MINRLIAVTALILSLIAVSTQVSELWSGLISRPTKTFGGTSFINNVVPQASDFNGDVDTIYGEFNGGITNINVSGTAAIAESKLLFSATGHEHTGSSQGNQIPTGGLEDGAITDVKVNASGITTRSKLPSAMAYEDEVNTFTLAQTFAVGSAAAPSINFTSQTTDGLFSKSATQVGEAINGVEVGYFDSSGNQSITGTYQSTKACVTNFSRADAIECIRTAGVPTTVSIGTSCTTIDLTTTNGLNSSVKTIRAQANLQLTSGTVVGNESITVDFYSDSGCTTRLGGDGKGGYGAMILDARSETTSSGNILVQYIGNIQLYVNGATTIYAKKVHTLVTNGGSTTSFLQVSSYRD